MKTPRSMIAVLAMLAFVPASYAAPDAVKNAPARKPALQKTDQDKLFAELADADSAEEAQGIEARLAETFKISGSPSVDLLMARINMAMASSDGKSDPGTARQLSDAVTRLAPDYAEGWRTHALLQLTADDHAGAMISLQKAVTINPRHFLAMRELAQMLEDFGDKPGALKLYRRVLVLDPKMDAAAERVKALTRDVEGQGI